MNEWDSGWGLYSRADVVDKYAGCPMWSRRASEDRDLQGDKSEDIARYCHLLTTQNPPPRGPLEVYYNQRKSSLALTFALREIARIQGPVFRYSFYVVGCHLALLHEIGSCGSRWEDNQVDKGFIEPTSRDGRIVGILPLLERVIGPETNYVLVRYIQFAPVRFSRISPRIGKACSGTSDIFVIDLP